ncbi:MAG: META domain-containing protein [Bacteroidota bacterium]
MFPRVVLLIVFALAAVAPPASSAPKHPKTKVSAKPRPSKAEVTGTATYRGRMTFAPSATFEATLEEVARPDQPGRVIGHDQQPNFGRTPIAFSIRYNPRRIDPARAYVVRAVIREEGRVRLSSDRAIPVLTRGHGSRATLVMSSVEYEAQGGERGHEMERRGDREREIDRDREAYRARENERERSRESDRTQAERERTRVSERDRGGRAAEEQRAALEGARWRPVQIGGRNVNGSGQEPWIEFDPRSSHIDGSGGCNRITGGYEVTGTSLRIHTLASTMMSCPSMDTERAFLRALDRTRTYRVMGRELELYDDTGSLLARLEERAR